jgi:hypothetical protein
LSTAKAIFLSMDLVAELSMEARLSAFSLLRGGLPPSSSRTLLCAWPACSFSPAILVCPVFTGMTLLISIVSSLIWLAA